MIYVTETKPKVWLVSQPCKSCGSNKAGEFVKHYHQQEIYVLGRHKTEILNNQNTLTINCVNRHEIGTFLESEVDVHHYGDKINLTPDGNDILKSML